MALTLLEEAIFAPKAWQFLHMPIPLLQSVSEVEGCISCRQGVRVVSEDVVGVLAQLMPSKQRGNFIEGVVLVIIIAKKVIQQKSVILVVVVLDWFSSGGND